MDELLGVAASAASSDARLKTIRYFIDNYEAHYKLVYRSSQVQIKFLPTVTGELETPKNCFSDTECMIMGFQALAVELQPYATVLGVARSPLSPSLVARLTKTPPSQKEAMAVFTYLGSQLHNFSSNEFDVLRKSRFIPVVIDGKHKETYHSVTEIYVGTGTGPFANHFTYVSFGDVGNAFLSACGAKEEPTPSELAANVISNPQLFLDNGVDKYLMLLKSIANQWPSIQQNTRLVKDMKKSQWLLGVVASENMDFSDDETIEKTQEKKTTSYKLGCAADIVMVDDTVLHKLFAPMSCPLDNALEDFYGKLGSEWISKLVTESFRPAGEPRESIASNRLLALIRERTPLLLYDIYSNPQARGGQHAKEAESLLNSLTVFFGTSSSIYCVLLGADRQPHF